MGNQISMQVVILAGGLGTRIQAVDAKRPKILLPVAGHPFVEHQFDLLRKNGLERVLLCIGHQGDQVENHVGDGSRFGMQVAYSREDPLKLLGTGGALLQALPQIEESFLLMYGDSYLPTDFRRIIHWFHAHPYPALMTVFRNEGKWDSSNVRVDGDRVVFYSKKARPGEADCIDYGLSVFRRSVLEAYKDASRPLDLARIQMDLVERGELGACMIRERFYEIGKPEGLAELDDVLRKQEPRMDTNQHGSSDLNRC